MLKLLPIAGVLFWVAPAFADVTYSMTALTGCDSGCQLKAAVSFTLPNFVAFPVGGGSIDLTPVFTCNLPGVPPRGCVYTQLSNGPLESTIFLMAVNDLTHEVDPYVGGIFTGVDLDSFGSWTVTAPQAFNAAIFTLTISNTAAAVPEPASYLLLLIALASLLGLKYRHRLLHYALLATASGH